MGMEDSWQCWLMLYHALLLLVPLQQKNMKIINKKKFVWEWRLFSFYCRVVVVVKVDQVMGRRCRCRCMLQTHGGGGNLGRKASSAAEKKKGKNTNTSSEWQCSVGRMIGQNLFMCRILTAQFICIKDKRATQAGSSTLSGVHGGSSRARGCKGVEQQLGWWHAAKSST